MRLLPLGLLIVTPLEVVTEFAMVNGVEKPAGATPPPTLMVPFNVVLLLKVTAPDGAPILIAPLVGASIEPPSPPKVTP